ncbi:MAG: hypothetical protein AAF761_08785 [Pseudomonadota bacterium]
MFDIIVSDLLRLAHLLAVAVGFGVAVETEIFMLKRRRTTVSPGMMSGLKHRHSVILYALGAMWVTGAALVALRTGFLLEAFTPKLWAKVTVVTILSVNAMFVAQVAMPILADHTGQRISALPVTAQRALFAVAGVSATSWLVALLLGSSTLLKTSPAWLFQSALPLAYVLGILIANVVGQHLYATRKDRRTNPTPFALRKLKRSPRPTAKPHALKAKRPAPPRAAVTTPLPAAPTTEPAVSLHERVPKVPRATPVPAAPTVTAENTKVTATKPQGRKQMRARKPKTPNVEVRASDLAIAFPQKLKRQLRLKPDPQAGPPLSPAQVATRERLVEVAAELTASR